MKSKAYCIFAALCLVGFSSLQGYSQAVRSPASPDGIVKIALKEGTRLAAGSGRGDPTQVAELLIEQMGPRGGPYFISFRNKMKCRSQVRSEKLKQMSRLR